MNTNIFVPKKINVGFQNRKDTYTGKLAYVIYFDAKGKLRKETSWNGWRDKEIPNEIYDNEPTEGFVLNKKVGGVEECWGWDPRKTYTRVYDPRGFEFEITIPNLLWILENCDSMRGKGLVGQFVYGWDGKELVLVPVESPDYKEIARKNEVFHKNEFIKAKDLKVGATYRSKNDKTFVYMGRFDRYDSGYWKNGLFFKSYNKFIKYCEDNDVPKVRRGTGWYARDYYESDSNDYGVVGKEHCFYYTYKDWNNKECSSFEWRTSIGSWLIDVVDDKCHEKYAEYFELLEHSPYYSAPDNNKVTYHEQCLESFRGQVTYNTNHYCSGDFLANINGEVRMCKAEQKGSSYDNKFVVKIKKDRNPNSELVEFLSLFPTETVEERINGWSSGTQQVKHMIPVTWETIYNTMHPLYEQTYLTNGKEYRKYYGY